MIVAYATKVIELLKISSIILIVADASVTLINRFCIFHFDPIYSISYMRFISIDESTCSILMLYVIFI